MKKFVLLILIATLFSFLSQQTWAEDTGWLFPTIYRNIINVDNPDLSLSDNGVTSRLGEDDSQIEYGGFGVSIPTSSVISGIEVQLKGAATPTRNLYIELSWNGEDFTNTSYTTNLTSTVTIYSFGNNLDLWGRSSWTATELNNFNFWISINTTASIYGSVFLDYIAVKVYYEVPDLITTFNTPGTYTYTVPAGVTEITAKAWGGGGGGSQSYNDGTLYPGAGGGGGGYITGTFSVSPGDNLEVTIGTGGEGASSINSDGLNGSNSVVEHSSGTIAAIGGRGGKSGAGGGSGGVGDSGSASGDVSNVQGHKGGNGIHGVENSGGGAGGGAGDSTNGVDASGSTGGDGGTASGGKGGNGSTDNNAGGNGSLYGGGGGGASTITGSIAGNGANGQIIISYEPSICIPPSGLVVESNSPVCESGDEDEGEDIELRASVSDGSEPLTYSWTGPNGFNSSFPTAYISSSISSSGTYTVTVTNACGPVTGSVNVEVIPGPEAGTISGYQTICTGGTAQLLVDGNSTEGTWSSLNTSVATINSSGVVTGIAAGEATITYTVNNAEGCSDVAEFPITVKIPSEFCHGSAYSVVSSADVINPENILGEPDDNVAVLDDYNDQVILDVTGGPLYNENYINIRWRDGSQLDGTAHPVVEYYYSQNGTNWFKNYTYTVTSEINFATQQLYFYQMRYIKFILVQNFDLDIDAITYDCPCIKPPAPNVIVENNCGNSTLTVTEFSGDLLWSTGETTPSITVASNGTYSVTQTVDECTSDATQKTVTILHEPTALAPTVGDGSSSNPYQIATLENLYWITTNSSSWDKNFIQTANIDASVTAEWCTGGWLPIGNGYADSEEELQVFSGNYNGDGHTISGLYITNSSSSAYGLMGRTKGAFIHDLGVIDVDINVVEYGPVGALIGYASGSTINNCYSTGNVKGGEDSEVGGLVGALSDTSTILNSYSTCNVNGYYRVGGLAGLNSFSSSITGCSHTSGIVDGNAGSSNFTGGLVGYNYNASLSKCYSTGTVLGYYYTGGLVGGNNDGGTISNCFSKCNCTSSADPTKCGGLVGINQPGSITNCYSTGTVGTDQGGLVAEHGGGEVSYSFWDNVTCDATSSRGGGIGISTSEMKTETTFTNVGWDFTTIWGLDAGINDGYPFFVPESSCNDGTIILSSAENTDNQSICEDSPITEITYTVSGGADSAKVEGLPNGVNGNFNSGTFTISGTPTVTGVYDYTVTTTGSSPCTEAIANGSITVNTLPTVDAGTFDAVCVDANDVALPAGGVWEGEGVVGNQTEGYFFDPTGHVGDNTLTFTVTDSETGCENSDEATIHVDDFYTANAGDDQSQCDNSTFTISAGSLTKAAIIGPSGIWEFVGENGGAIITDKYSETTTVTNVPLDQDITLRWTVTNGTCSDFDDVVLRNNSLPTASTANLEECDKGNGTADFTLTNADATVIGAQTGVSVTYHATQGDADNDENVLVIPYSSGSTMVYARVEIDATGCYETSVVSLTVKPFPNAGTILGSNEICGNETTQLNIDGGDINGTWTSSNNDIATVDATGLVTGVSKGAVTITYTVIGSGGCEGESDFSEFNVLVSPQPDAGNLIGSQEICVGNITQLKSDQSKDGTWSSDNEAVAKVDGLGNVTGLTAGNATIKYTVEGTGACTGESDIASLVINVFAPPIAGDLEGTSGICINETSQLTTNGDQGGSWSSSDKNVVMVDSKGSVTGVAAGTATITYTVAGAGDCKNDESALNITVFTNSITPTSVVSNPETSMFGDRVCPEDEVTLKISGGDLGTNPGAYWAWYEEDWGVGNPIGTGESIVVTPTRPTIYHVGAVGGCNPTGYTSVKVWMWPETEITEQPSDALISYGCQTKIEVAATGHNLSYQWYQNSIQSNEGGNPIPNATATEFWPDCSESGIFYYYVVVNGECTEVISRVATLTIDQQVANASGILYYTGPKFAFTQNETSSNATVVFSATIKNNASQICSDLGTLNTESGDIRTALLSFEIDKGSGWEKIPCATNLPVNFVDPNNISLGGTAAAIAQIDIGDESCGNYMLRVVVSGNYTGNPEKMECPITIVKPQAGGIITGTVGLCNDNSAGFIKGMSGNEYHTVLNFEVKYSETTKVRGADQPKGKVWLLISSLNNPQGIPDGQEHTYMISSNAIADLTINCPKAHFSAKANVIELLDDGTMNSLEGNCTMVLDLEKGETEEYDKVGITVYRAKAKGGIWYSNNWTTAGKTVPDYICEPGFEIGGCNGAAALVTEKTKSAILQPQIEKPEYKVYPNPFSDRLNFQFVSHVDTHVRIDIYDLTGRMIRTVFNDQVEAEIIYNTDFIPENTVSSMYIYRMIMGESVFNGKVAYKEK